MTTCASCLGLGSLAHRRLALAVALVLDNLRLVFISRADALKQLRLLFFFLVDDLLLVLLLLLNCLITDANEDILLLTYLCFS